MNIHEAIEQLKFDKELAKRDYISPTNHEEYDLAISALEKQIPKRIKEIPTKWLPFYECECSGHIDYYDKNNYCPNCGQKLDWSVEE